MTPEEAAIRLKEALAIHLDALDEALADGLDEIPDHGQYEHARDVVRRFGATNPSVSEN